MCEIQLRSRVREKDYKLNSQPLLCICAEIPPRHTMYFIGISKENSTRCMNMLTFSLCVQSERSNEKVESREYFIISFQKIAETF